MRKSIKKRAGFDIDSLNPETGVDKLKMPIVFLHSEDDTFVRFEHSRILY